MSDVSIIPLSSEVARGIGAVGLVALVAGTWYLVRKGLRDASAAGGCEPFSLSRVQMLWWTLMILGSDLIAMTLTGKFIDLNSTALILLGIGGGTSAFAQVIDSSETPQTAAGERHQDLPSDGFLTDILSDGQGVGVHRLQMVMFNLVYGLTFAATVITQGLMPEYSNELLGLLGISSSTYVGMKTMENKTPPAAPPAS